MKPLYLFFFSIIYLHSTLFSFANEKKDHICFRAIDANKDGMVTFQEFKKFYGDDQKKFNSIDSNKDNKLSHDEYHKALGKHGNF